MSRFNNNRIMRYVTRVVLLSLLCWLPFCTYNSVFGDERNDIFGTKLKHYSENMKAFPIDFLLMPRYRGEYKSTLNRGGPGLLKDYPPWSYYSFRYELNNERLNLWRSFIHFAFYADKNDLDYCETLIKDASPKERALLLTVLFFSVDEKYLALFEKFKNETSIAFPAIHPTEEERQIFVKDAEAWIWDHEGRFWAFDGPDNGIERACFIILNRRSATIPELIVENAENSSEKPKTVADFANAFLWYWYHFEEDKKLDQQLFFSKFMKDDRTIPVFSNEKYEELRRRLEVEPFYYTKVSIRWDGVLNGPQKDRIRMCGDLRKYVESLPEDAHFLLQDIPDYSAVEPNAK